MNKHIYVTIFIILIPFSFVYLGTNENEAIRNASTLIELFYLMPCLIAKETLFTFQHDIGLIATNLGRIIATSLYLALYWLVVVLYRKNFNNGAKYS